MLEKNKDYVEMRVSSTDCAFTQNAPTQISVDGCVYTPYMRLPDPGEFYILISKEKFEKMQADVNINAEIAKQWEINYDLLLKKTGFDTVEELVFYLTNEAEADTLHEAISKLKDQVKYTCDEWYSANSSNNSWKAAAECNSPKELIEKLNLLRDDISGRCTVIESYKRDIEKWQKATGCLRPEDISTESMVSKSMANEITAANENLWRENEKCEKRIEGLLSEIREWRETTGCPSPSSAKTLIESGASWMSAYHSSCEVIKTWKKLTGCPTPIAAQTLIESGMSYESGYHEVQEENRKLTDEVESWKHYTGYETPEGFLSAMAIDPDNVWHDATGCDTPEEAGCKINNLCNEICKLKGDYDNLLKLTGYKSEQDIRVLLNDSEQFVYKDMRELINSLKRKAKFTESGWQVATGRSDPEAAKQYIDRLKGRLNKIHGCSVDW